MCLLFQLHSGLLDSLMEGHYLHWKGLALRKGLLEVPIARTLCMSVCGPAGQLLGASIRLIAIVTPLELG